MEQITDLTALLSVAGTSAFVLLLTQYIKPHLPERLPIRLFVLAVCAVIQIGLTLFLTPTIEAVLIAIGNSLLAAVACMGTYEATFNRKEK